MYSMMNDVQTLPRGERLVRHLRAGKPFPRRARRVFSNFYAFNTRDAAERVRHHAAPMTIVRARTQRIRRDVMDAMYAHVAVLVRGCCGEETVSAEWVRCVAMELKRDVLRAVGVEVK